jgi:lipopolysaccharide assembly protein A
VTDQQLSSGPGTPDGRPPAAAPQAAPGPPQHVVKRTRAGGLWLAIGSFAVVLLLLLIFILENGRGVDVAYLGAHGHLPLGVALLLAAVLGAGTVAIPAAARIAQLRRTARRHRLADAERPAGER